MPSLTPEEGNYEFRLQHGGLRVVMEASISNGGFIESIINMFSCCWPDKKCVCTVS